MTQFSTDRSIQRDWIARKGNDNSVTFTFTSSGAFDVSSYTFALYIFRFGADYNTLANAVISKTQGSGLTNNGAAGTVGASLTASNLSSLQPDQYFWKLQVTHPDGTVHDWFNGQFSLQNELWVGDVTSSVSGTISVAGVSIDTAITIGGNSVSAASQSQVNTGTATGVYVNPATLQDKDDTAVALTDAATIDITGPKHTLTTATGRTFTISHLGDHGTVDILLSATSATFVFPATALCMYAGQASGNNNLVVSSATSGDHIMVGWIRQGSDYRVTGVNFGQ